MRKLIIRRKKSFVACLGKVSIFIEDEQGDFALAGTKCKLLGVLKNGKVGEYDISTNSLKVFGVFSKVNPERFHAYYQLPQADELFTLNIAPRYEPMAGNPFTFYL